jgi:uncharacterized LabA/DUF88 family protein/cold shock CspA family protein
MVEADKRLTRIGVFYDGNYFLHVSNYYNYEHNRKARISIGGLHDFIRSKVAQEEGNDIRFCQIVDAHYFRGRLTISEASNPSKLLSDRLFDDVLMTEGVITHYLPLKTRGGKLEEKGIDVWLALESFELAQYKKYNVVVLVASDGDYVPLVRKLNTLGTRVMVLSWDFEYRTDGGKEMITRTSQDLLEEVTYAVPMHEIIENRAKRNDPIINNIFVQDTIHNNKYSEINKDNDNKTRQSTVVSVKNGYGFIFARPDNLFFHYSDVIDGDFNELADGDLVEYTIGRNREGGEVARSVKKIRSQNVDSSNGNEYAKTTYYEMKEKTAKLNSLGQLGTYTAE